MKVIEFLKDKLTGKSKPKLNPEYTEEIIQKNMSYDAFIYLQGTEDEYPAFVHNSDKNGELMTADIVFAFDPTLLIHCVENLTPAAREVEKNNISAFYDKCHRLAAASPAKITQEEWNTLITDLSTKLQSTTNKK